MQALILILMVVATTFNDLATRGWLPGMAKYSFELISAIVLLYVVILGVRSRFENIRTPYILIFGTLVVVIICGIVLNTVAPGPMFQGMRNYLRPIPLFFLPAIYAFTDRQLRTQLQLLLVIALIQIPTSLLERMGTIAIGGITGDTTVGTLQSSSFLSIFEIGGICIVVAMFLRKQLSITALIVLFLLLVFPTTINETKATFLLLPLALLVVFQVLAAPGTRVRNLVVALGLVAVFAAIFIPIYDTLIARRQYSQSITDFFTEQNAVGSYLDKNAQLGVTSSKQAGRLDSMVVPIKSLARDPSQLMFGLGIGNVSNSALGPKFIGRYYPVYQFFLQTTISRLVLELGLFGLGLLGLLYWTIFRDSLAVAASDPSLRGALAAAWAGITIVIVLSNAYKDLIVSDALSCLFWYFSGLIAAQRMRLAHAAQLQRRPHLNEPQGVGAQRSRA